MKFLTAALLLSVFALSGAQSGILKKGLGQVADLGQAVGRAVGDLTQTGGDDSGDAVQDSGDDNADAAQGNDDDSSDTAQGNDAASGNPVQRASSNVRTNGQGSLPSGSDGSGDVASQAFSRLRKYLGGLTNADSLVETVKKSLNSGNFLSLIFSLSTLFWQVMMGLFTGTVKIRSIGGILEDIGIVTSSKGGLGNFFGSFLKAAGSFINPILGGTSVDLVSSLGLGNNGGFLLGRRR